MKNFYLIKIILKHTYFTHRWNLNILLQILVEVDLGLMIIDICPLNLQNFKTWASPTNVFSVTLRLPIMCGG